MAQRDELTENQSGRISRREFIQKSAILSGSLAAATTLVDTLGAGPAYAAQVDASDPGLISSDVQFASTDGTSVGGYLTRPKGDGPLPAIVVIHENQGQTDHIRDVARRLAKAGYVRVSPGPAVKTRWY